MNTEVRSLEDEASFSSKLTSGLRKSTEMYNYGKRGINIIHAQMRMCCSNLRAHLYMLHVTDDPICVCNQGIEDNHYFFLLCPLYVNMRNIVLASISLICEPNLETILYGNDDCDLNTNLYSMLYTPLLKHGWF